MIEKEWLDKLISFDKRRDLIIPGDKSETLNFCVEHFITIANHAIESRGNFFVALSGGSTPKAIFQQLVLESNRNKIDWNKVWLFWSDERAVPPTDADSNFHMAMEAGFSKLPIPPEQIHRMPADTEIEESAKKYEELVESIVPGNSFDLMMLGMGGDGHTASLFPKTHGLHSPGRLVIANFLPDKNVWRMSMTYECINNAKHTALYVMGSGKADILHSVLNSGFQPDLYPVQSVGTSKHKALFILDTDSATNLDLIDMHKP